MRIELGRSLPTIVKLQYISDKLGVSLNLLLGETKLDIPEDYYHAKYKPWSLLSMAILECIKKKQDIEELLWKYIDILPEEELLNHRYHWKNPEFISEERKKILLRLYLKTIWIRYWKRRVHLEWPFVDKILLCTMSRVFIW